MYFQQKNNEILANSCYICSEKVKHDSVWKQKFSCYGKNVVSDILHNAAICYWLDLLNYVRWLLYILNYFS